MGCDGFLFCFPALPAYSLSFLSPTPTCKAACRFSRIRVQDRSRGNGQGKLCNCISCLCCWERQKCKWWLFALEGRCMGYFQTCHWGYPTLGSQSFPTPVEVPLTINPFKMPQVWLSDTWTSPTSQKMHILIYQVLSNSQRAASCSHCCLCSACQSSQSLCFRPFGCEPHPNSCIPQISGVKQRGPD